MTGEQWRDVPGWVGIYQVSDRGRVRSVDRTAPDGRRVGGQLLAARQASNGYLTVTLGRGLVRQTIGVHRLVLAAFRGTRHRWTQVRHLDGDRTNNKLRNLKWGDQRLNERDKKRGKGRGKGEGRKRENRNREIGEIGRGFPGPVSCVTLFHRRRGWVR